jgi:voltage-gated sodium channel
MQQRISKLVKSNTFMYTITVVIIINAILIGVELSYDEGLVPFLQNLCITIFIIEIALRWIGKDSVKDYVKNGWNWFDIIIVGVSLIPPNIFEQGEVISAFRVIRVFRVFRLLKAFPSIGLMARVLIKSVTSLLQAIGFLLIFMYLYALIGVILFKGESQITNQNGLKIDPFGTISEATFSLFRVTTAEDWTDLRYDLMESDENNLLVNIYFVSWMILSAFLLVNIIVGAIVNNYDLERQKARADEQDNRLDFIQQQLEEISKKLDSKT